MFSPITPILSAATPGEDVGRVLARVEAINTVLAVLMRMTGSSAAAELHGLDRQADLSAALADMEDQRLTVLTRELDAIAAALQAGFTAMERARARGHAAHAAARLLTTECREAFAATLAEASARGLSA